jgi:hypothetical protein
LPPDAAPNALFQVEQLLLELPGGGQLFGSNAIVEYLFKSTSDVPSAWSLWEETQFRPLAFLWLANPDGAYGA